MSDYPGGNGGFGGGSGPTPIDEMRAQFSKHSKKLGFFGPGVIFGIVAALWIISGFYTVEADEQAIVRRFGEFMPPIQESGGHWYMRFVEQVDNVKVTKIYSTEVGFRTVDPGPPARYREVPDESLMLTGDENIVAIDFIVQYKISDPVKYLFRIADAENTLKEVAESAMREVIGKRKIDDVLTEHKAEIQAQVMELGQNVLNKWDTGLQLQAVKLQDVTPPKEVDAAFKDVASAREDKDKIVKQADGYRNDLLPKAKGEAAKMVNEAQAYAQERIALSQGQSDRFRKVYNEYVSAKDITRKRLYLEALEEVMESADKIILDAEAGRNTLPFLPLRGNADSGGR